MEIALFTITTFIYFSLIADHRPFSDFFLFRVDKSDNNGYNYTHKTGLYLVFSVSQSYILHDKILHAKAGGFLLYHPLYFFDTETTGSAGGGTP